MDKFDRIYAFHTYVKHRRTAVTLDQICHHLECSPATAKRVIDCYRNFLGAPLIYDRELRGYRPDSTGEDRYKLPGLWFNDSELFGLLLSYRLLLGIQPGLLDEQITPIRERVERLLSNKRLGGGELDKKVKILQVASRPAHLEHFHSIASAVLHKDCLKILYHGRKRDEITERIISPQRIVYYRDNWYLDAWCHLRKALRIFSIDRIYPVCTANTPYKELDPCKLDKQVTFGYGIFSGKVQFWIKLKFTPDAARWVADEHWHPDQKMTTDKDGSLILEIPCSQPDELIRDILKYGPDVYVLEPSDLRESIKEKLKKSFQQYCRRTEQLTF